MAAAVIFTAGVTVTVRRPAGWTDSGDALPAADHEVPRCAWAPRRSSRLEAELTDLRETVLDGGTLRGPIDADIRASDQVLIPDVLDDHGDPIVWEVDGDVDRWKSPFSGRQFGFHVELKRATG